MKNSGSAFLVDIHLQEVEWPGVAAITRDGITLIHHKPLEWLSTIGCLLYLIAFIGWILHFFLMDKIPRLFSIVENVFAIFVILYILAAVIAKYVIAPVSAGKIQEKIDKGTLNRKSSSKDVIHYAWNEIRAIGIEKKKGDHYMNFISDEGYFTKLSLQSGFWWLRLRTRTRALEKKWDEMLSAVELFAGDKLLQRSNQRSL